MFLATEPWILSDAADYAFNCLYNIHKCLEIMEYLKINANNLVFCSAPIKNEKARDFHSNSTDINICRKEVKFYDSLNNDYLYRKFHE